jgi:hypothetical protein
VSEHKTTVETYGPALLTEETPFVSAALKACAAAAAREHAERHAIYVKMVMKEVPHAN